MRSITPKPFVCRVSERFHPKCFKRGITPVVAVVVLLLMTVAAAGMAFLTITSYQQEAHEGTQAGIENIGSKTRTQLKIESVSDGQIYLRNLGTETFSNPAFYVEGKPLNVTGPNECDSGSICVYTVQEDVDCEGNCELTMGADAPVGTSVSVSEEEIEGSPQYTLTTFSDDSTQKNLLFSQSGSDASANITLPTNATVISASLDISGLLTPLMWDKSLATGGGLSDNTGNSFWPTVDIDSNNNTHIFWSDVSSGNTEIYYAYWNYTTNSWNKSLATGGGLSDNPTASGNQFVAIDSFDNLHITWYNGDGSDWEIYYAYWNYTTNSWNKSLATGGGLSDNAGASLPPSIAIDSLDNVHIAWYDDSAGDQEIYYAYWNLTTGAWNKSLATGGGLSDNTGLSENPIMSVDSQDNIHMVWNDYTGGDAEVYYAYKNYTTGSWNKTYASGGGLSDNTGGGVEVFISVDIFDDIHVVWVDDGGGDFEIYYMQYNLTTGAWNKSLATGGGLSDNTGVSHYPEVVSDSFGNTHVMWRDNSGGGDDEIYYAYWNSTTGFWNKTFASGYGISDSTAESTYPDLTVDSMGNVHFVWKDSSDGDGEVYYAIYGKFPPYTPVLDTGSDGDSEWNYTGKYTTSQTTSDLSNEINSILPSCTCTGCVLSSGYCTIDLNITCQSAGKIRISNLNIVYT